MIYIKSSKQRILHKFIKLNIYIIYYIVYFFVVICYLTIFKFEFKILQKKLIANIYEAFYQLLSKLKHID